MSKFLEQLFLGLFSVIILFSLVACSKSETRQYIKSTKNKNNKIAGVDSPILVVGTSSGMLEDSVHQFSAAEVGKEKLSGLFTLKNMSTENVSELSAKIESDEFRFNSEDGSLAGSGDCINTLETGKTCKFEIAFAPKSGGEKNADVVFSFKAKGQEKTMIMKLAGNAIGLDDKLANPVGGLSIAGKDDLLKFSAKAGESSEIRLIKVENVSNKVITGISISIPLENGFAFVGGEFPGKVSASAGDSEKTMCGQKDLAIAESCSLAIVYSRARDLSQNSEQVSILKLRYSIVGVEKPQYLQETLVGSEKVEEVTVETSPATAQDAAAQGTEADSKTESDSRVIQEHALTKEQIQGANTINNKANGRSSDLSKIVPDVTEVPMAIQNGGNRATVAGSAEEATKEPGTAEDGAEAEPTEAQESNKRIIIQNKDQLIDSLIKYKDILLNKSHLLGMNENLIVLNWLGKDSANPIFSISSENINVKAELDKDANILLTKTVNADKTNSDFKPELAEVQCNNFNDTKVCGLMILLKIKDTDLPIAMLLTESENSATDQILAGVDLGQNKSIRKLDLINFFYSVEGSEDTPELTFEEATRIVEERIATNAKQPSSIDELSNALNDLLNSKDASGM